MLASKCKAVKMRINVARTKGYLENILPPKGYLGQKSLGTSAIKAQGKDTPIVGNNRLVNRYSCLVFL